MLTAELLLHRTGHHTQWHRHEAGQLCRITTGLMVIETHKGRSVVPAKHIVWVPPGQLHAASSESAIEGCSLYLDSACCSALPGETTLFDADDLTSALFMRLSEQGSEHDPRMLSVLLDELARSARNRYLLPMPADSRLSKVTRHLMQRVDDNHTVEHHARHVGMSVRTFNRRFRAETGMNFVNWRQLARVVRAMEWLAAGKPVGWIALSCGYSSVSAFIAIFRAYTGKTPKQWTLKESHSA